MNKIKIEITSVLTLSEIYSIVTEKIEKDNPKFKIICIDPKYIGDYEDATFDGFNIKYELRNL